MRLIPPHGKILVDRVWMDKFADVDPPTSQYPYFAKVIVSGEEIVGIRSGMYIIVEGYIHDDCPQILDSAVIDPRDVIAIIEGA